MSAIQEFRDFILRGNVVDLAVGVVIGGAFTGVVGAFTKDVLTPFIGLPGKVNLSGFKYHYRGSDFLFGDFLNTTISFIITAAVVFFFVVKPINWLMSKRKTDTPTAPETRECPYCLSKVPIAASRCAFCTSELSQTA